MYNLVSYSFYFLLVCSVILYVGHLCYRNGHVFIHALIPASPDLNHQINRLLLVGYYLVNLGYAIYIISEWEQLQDWRTAAESLARHLSQIILMLGLLHYVNIAALRLFLKPYQSFKS
ncbi:hypothetical protein [Nonlabens xiamenensis]|uniref:hypothetical protein n=1 Tax=Nonlabens xiamenensis TaxID=2341043 RepID=UPI000F606076|nr:hypothetical protein [Nonlabens xiamenensis]